MCAKLNVHREYLERILCSLSRGKFDEVHHSDPSRELKKQSNLTN